MLKLLGNRVETEAGKLAVVTGIGDGHNPMLYDSDGNEIARSRDVHWPGKPLLVWINPEEDACFDRWAGKAFEDAEKIAAFLTDLTGGLVYVATDNRPHSSPPFDVIRAPAVGDKVSAAFNGDFYPEGEIVRVSPSLRVVTTSTGARFYRLRATGVWLKDGTWHLYPGHVSKRNPSF